jgi:hypothetical protein
MLLISPEPLANYAVTSAELIEEYRRQSALASSADRTDIGLMSFLDQILLDTEQTPPID